MVNPMDTQTRHGHAALRRCRHGAPQRLYHVTVDTAGRRPLFADFGTACAAARTTQHPALWRSSRLLCWVLMPDRLHLLLELGEGDALGPVMTRIKSAIARHANRAAGRKGACWQRAYHERALRRQDDVLAVARYIVGHPLRAGLVERVGDYPFWDAAWLRPGDPSAA